MTCPHLLLKYHSAVSRQSAVHEILYQELEKILLCGNSANKNSIKNKVLLLHSAALMFTVQEQEWYSFPPYKAQNL